MQLPEFLGTCNKRLSSLTSIGASLMFTGLDGTILIQPAFMGICSCPCKRQTPP
jgi:hypothetical protein